MITESLQTLKIHKLTQEQYNRSLEAGTIDKNALYLTPDEIIDLSPYATIEHVANTYETKMGAFSRLNEAKIYTDEAIAEALSGQTDLEHTHDDRYYTKEEIDETVVRIDTSISSLDSRVDGYETAISNVETKMTALEALAAANQAAIEANASAISQKVSQEDLDEVIERIAVVETDLASFTEITSNEVQNLFQ